MFARTGALADGEVLGWKGEVLSGEGAIAGGVLGGTDVSGLGWRTATDDGAGAGWGDVGDAACRATVDGVAGGGTATG
jgi:hypothetical protein